MYYGIVDIVKIVTIFQIFLISVFLIFNSNRNRKRNLLLVFFVMSKAFFLLDTLLISYYKIIMPVAPDAIVIGSSFQWLVGPTLFFTIVVTTHREFVFKYKHILNVLPFLLHLGFMISQFHIYDYETKYTLLQNGFPYNMPWSKLFACANYIQFAIYGILALRVLSGVRKKMSKTSSQSIERNIFYFKFLIYDFITVWGINAIAMFVPLSGTISAILLMLTVLNIFFIANAIVFQGLKFPEIFHEEVSNKQKYEKNLLTELEKNKYAEKLREYMITQKPYLNPALSLSDLAEKLGLSAYTLSQVMNLALKQNFYDFVNSYRVEESKKLFTSENGNGSTILEVIYKSGFNSKSVFNVAFKKYTGTTPREFKKVLNSSRQDALSVNLS
jgi:AraC-like DNA-binding protein